MKDLISVIMPCYNSSAHIADSVASALGQSYGAVELLVVDDGSTDDSRQILDALVLEHGDRLRIFSQDNSGPFPARNLALEKAHGAFIAFLDSDDYWDRDFLQKLHNALTGNDVDLAYCGWQNVGEHAPGGKPFIPSAYEDDDMVSRFLESCPWPIHAALTRRHVINSIGGFSTRFFSSMDYDLWLRVLTVTKRIKEVPEVLAYYRWHGAGQISAIKWRQVTDAWNVRKDFIEKNPSLISHIGERKALDIANKELLDNAYNALWQRDTESAFRLFRLALVSGVARPRDFRYALPTLLPFKLFKILIRLIDSRSQ